MRWNWQLPEWPQFTYDQRLIADKERAFLLSAGSSLAFLKNIGKEEYSQFAVEILSAEGVESSKIEGEYLDRESLQSSIKKHFGLKPPDRKEKAKEAEMAKLLIDVYQTFADKLSDKKLCEWQSQLFGENSHITDRGTYRTHEDPMQIISGRYGSEKVFFEAPPSSIVPQEMKRYIKWFNDEVPGEPVLGKAAIAHLYFENIHPFEDGNGRIGRLLIEKVLSQGVGRPVLIAVSKVFERRKKEYYAALERCNRTLKVDHWVEFFSDAVLQAQAESMKLLVFLIEKAKVMSELKDQLNERQEKVMIRLFEEGPEGFKGGLSAEKYIAITKTSKATATRDLNDLVEKKALVKTGELRHTRYWLRS